MRPYNDVVARDRLGIHATHGANDIATLENESLPCDRDATNCCFLGHGFSASVSLCRT
jgi:hypothetical protein